MGEEGALWIAVFALAPGEIMRARKGGVYGLGTLDVLISEVEISDQSIT